MLKTIFKERPGNLIDWNTESIRDLEKCLVCLRRYPPVSSNLCAVRFFPAALSLLARFSSGNKIKWPDHGGYIEIF
jgi:hypothetical protein